MTEVERAPVENIGVDPARLRQEFSSDRDIARIDLDAGDLGEAFAPFAAVVDDVGQNADAGAKVDDAPPCPVEREVASEAKGREERARRAVLMRRAFVPVLKNKVPLVVGDAVLGQDRLGLGMGLALLFGEFRHGCNPSVLEMGGPRARRGPVRSIRRLPSIRRRRPGRKRSQALPPRRGRHRQIRRAPRPPDRRRASRPRKPRRPR